MNAKTITYRSNGKLLLTGEYVVLSGANALALPTKYGQSLKVVPNESHKIIWKSYDELGAIWFEAVFDTNTIKTDGNGMDQSVTDRLQQIFLAAKGLNPKFLESNQGYTITTHQDFNRHWGLGTSSTLINNIANWAKVDAYELLKKTFGGSGYDIACAKHNTPLTYRLSRTETPLVEPIGFAPPFKSQLYFVYLNQKQDSRKGIAHYSQLGINPQESRDNNRIEEINAITAACIACKTLGAFEKLMIQHESIISQLLGIDPIKQRLFNDFEGIVKSLGAWGGDFVLATSKTNPTDYFNSKGFATVLPYDTIVLH